MGQSNLFSPLWALIQRTVAFNSYQIFDSFVTASHWLHKSVKYVNGVIVTFLNHYNSGRVD